MADEGIEEKAAIVVVNDLMNSDDEASRRVDFYVGWIDARVQDGPLAGPIFTNAGVAVDVATFHAIWPNDGGLHAGENCVEAAGVEISIGSMQKFTGGEVLVYFHGFYSGWSGDIRQMSGKFL